MAAEPVAQPVGQAAREPAGVAAGTAGAEPLGERLGDEGHRDLLFEGFLDGPGARGAAGHVVGDGAEIAAFLAERFLAELQQPRPDHSAVVPGSCDGLQVEIVAPLVEQLEPLAVGLHERVLDAVVHHFDVVTGACRPHAVVAVRAGSDGVEDGHEVVVRPLGAADHQGEPEFRAGGAARGATVEVREVVFLGAARRVLEVAVPAVHDDAVGVEAWREFVEGGVNGVARRHHQPDALLGTELRGECVQRVGGRRARVSRVLARGRVDVERDHVVAGVETAVDDDAPHAAEADDSEFHG